MTKVLSTHVMIGQLGTLHVELSRVNTLRLFDIANNNNVIGVDLPILVRKQPSDLYQRTLLWVGIDHIRKAFVADEHEVEVSEVPFSPLSEDEMLNPAQTLTPSDDGLVVEL